VLAEPDQTQFDLRFRLFGVPVRVHPFFWVVSAFLGWDLINAGFIYLVAWIGCVFGSVLLHELGHVWMGQVFGSRGHIVLHGFGGLAIGSSAVPRRWQRVLVLAAGPGIQFVLLFGVVFMLRYVLGTLPLEAIKLLAPVLGFLYVINLYWPLLNLLPIWPLDGGQITREVCEGASPRNGTVFALTLSLVLSGLLALHVLLLNFYYRGGEPEEGPLAAYDRSVGRYLEPYLPGSSLFMGLFFALFAVYAWQALQSEKQKRRSYWDDDVPPWER